MRRIRQDSININAGMTNKGEPRPTSLPVDVWADDHATDEIFRGTGAPVGGGLRSRAGEPEPKGPAFPDATFKPQGMSNTPAKPGGPSDNSGNT